MVFAERILLQRFACFLAGRIVIRLHKDVVLIQLDEIPAVAADCHVAVLDIAVEGFSGLFTSCNRVNCEFRPREYIAAGEDVGLCCLVCQFIGERIYSTEEFDLRPLEEISELDALADREDNEVCIECNKLILIIFRSKTMLCVENGSALFENYSADLVLTENLFRAPAGIDNDSVLAGLASLERGGGHDVFGFKRKHGDGLGAASLGDSGGIDCDVSASDDNDLAADLLCSCIGFMEEIHSRCGTGKGLSGDSREASALASDCNVESLVALFSELGDGDILADFDSGPDLNADFSHYIYLSVNYFLFKFEGRNTIAEHTAGLLVLFEDCRLVSHCG